MRTVEHGEETIMPAGPTDELKEEHVLVLMVVEAMEREVTSIQETGRVHTDRVAQMIDFTRNFTDGFHHYKEERVLFPVLEERSRAGAGQVSVLLSEHDAGRECVRAVVDNLPRANEDEVARKAVEENLGLYAFLLRLHINKEDTVLFPLADEVLSDQESEIMAGDFARAEAESGSGSPERFHALAHSLATPPRD
jgi:hemerythrin-like domain-containing protein